MRSFVAWALHQIFNGDQVKENETGGACTTHVGQMRNAYKVLGGKPEVKRIFGRPRRTWKANIKMYLRKTGREVVS
jgi:hypothetical protein